MRKLSPPFLLLFLIRSSQPAQDSWGLERREVDFLSQCRGGMLCQGLRCSSVSGGRDFSLELLQELKCLEDTDCGYEETGLACVKGGCECPIYQALNVSSCRCQAAAQCRQECQAQHNGRSCQDKFCSCYPSPDFSTLLVDPASLFCILPAGEADLSYGTAGLTVLCVLGGLACCVLFVVMGMVLHKNCVCEKGAYECEDVPDVPHLPHVAAWDHPSLDYIPTTGEEDIVFTLALAKDNVRMSNASTIHVVDEEVTDYNLNNDNRGYVDDVDDPRHD